MEDRLRGLNNRPVRSGGRYVLYWMQAARRVECNHALLYASQLANQLDVPLLCFECLLPEASERSHAFVLEGVPEREKSLRKLGVGYVFQSQPGTALQRLARDAVAVVTDDHPTLTAPAKFNVASYAVESSCIVPMSRMEKQEYAAYTIRPKIRRLLPDCLRQLPPVRVKRKFREPLPPREAGQAPLPSLTFCGSRSIAEKHLARFLRERLRLYARHRNEPTAHATSELSPYLHFGVISPIEVALRTRAYAEEHRLAADEFLEELIVRRELAFNFVRHSWQPQSLEALPNWARQTLREHARDRRSAVYSQDQFEQARTHDALWNATQKEMLLRGKIHGYYRMYWGKKIIEWSTAPEAALETMLHIHARHALDGNDPNTYAGILWCFGLHDRPWPRRPVFGTVRYMSLEGMRRKTHVEAYMAEIAALERTGRDPFRIQ